MNSSKSPTDGAVPPVPRLHVETVTEVHNEPALITIQNGTELSTPSTDESPPSAKNLPLYRKVFDDNMQNKPVKYDQAYVLLLSWADEIDDLKVKPEFDQLEAFLDKTYGFKVQRRQLGLEKPAHQLNQFLSTFMLDNDDEDHLLIIYYGGHGVYQNKPGDQYNGIQWHPSASQGSKNHLVWSKAEHCITESKGDVLVVFDCCYAGSFGGKKVRAAQPNFEFIAACGAKETAALPGEKSFTTAFMWALKDFKDRVEHPFTSRALVDKIKTRLKDQTPELQVRDAQACGSIWISPQNLQTPITQNVPQGEHRRAHHEYLDLRLNFYRRIEPADAGNVARHLSRLVRDEEDFAKEITLINVSNPAAEYVYFWKDYVRRKRSISQSESFVGTGISETTDLISAGTAMSTDVDMSGSFHEVELPGIEEPPQKRLNQRRNEREGSQEVHSPQLQSTVVHLHMHVNVDGGSSPPRS